jgi:hypothetical protein
MTKTVEEVRRAAFEAWAITSAWLGLGEAPERHGKGYAEMETHTAWEAFSAALDAVEIQLPKACAYESLDRARVFVQLTYEIGSDTADPVEMVRLSDCRTAIEQTGLGLKIK